ncbi:magnesium transporter CorA family protein [Candidatus Daviesbacteria bacterium]|nr:magnesium transporter CorA family protein [Candidatus Daviesbacteria bacterium]
MNINTVTLNKFSFIDVHDLKETEIKYLRKTYNFSQIHLDDYVSGQQVPKIEAFKDYILIVLDFPFVESSDETGNGNHTKPPEPNTQAPNNNGVSSTITGIITSPLNIPKFLFAHAKEKRLRTGHINFFIGKDFLVVLHDEKTPEIDKIFESCQSSLKVRETYLVNGPFHLFYLIVDTLVDSTFGIMKEVAASIDDINLHLLQNYSPLRIVEEISATRRNLVLFKSILSPALDIFKELRSDKYKEFGEFDIASYSSLSDHIKKILYRLEGSSELLDGIARSHESLLTAKTNETIKVLTMFTAILLPLTLLTGIYGMNVVGLPGAETEGILTLLSLIMAIIAVSMILAFKIRRWF